VKDLYIDFLKILGFFLDTGASGEFKTILIKSFVVYHETKK